MITDVVFAYSTAQNAFFCLVGAILNILCPRERRVFQSKLGVSSSNQGNLHHSPHTGHLEKKIKKGYNVFRTPCTVVTVTIIELSNTIFSGRILRMSISFSRPIISPGYLSWCSTRYGVDVPGIESRGVGGCEIFRTRPDWPCSSPSLLCSGYRVFPGGKAAGAWR